MGRTFTRGSRSSGDTGGRVTFKRGKGRGGGGTTPTPTEPPPSDTTPNAFSFTPVIDAELSTVTTSDVVTISGIDAAASVSVSGLEYTLNGGSTWTDLPGTIQPGGTLQLRDTSSNLNSTTVSGTVTVGGVTVSWSVRTKAASPPAGTLVTTQAELLAELADEAGGFTLRIGPGEYPFTQVRDRTYASPVVLVAGDADDPPVFAGLWFNGCSNLSIDGLTVRPGGAPPYGISLVGCDEIAVTGSLFAKASSAQPYIGGYGMFVRSSTNIDISGCEYKWMQYGIAHLNCDFLTITGCHFHDLGTDGIQGGGSNDVTISGNRFHSFTWPDNFHPDAIQFWTTNVTRLTERLTITDNLIYRGSGVATQGLFMGDEHAKSYSAVTIEGNAFVGCLYHGLTLCGSATLPAAGIVMRDNFVQGFAGQQSWMRALYVATLTTGDNQYSYLNNANVTSTTDEGGNVLITGAAAAGDYTLLDAWLVTHPDVPERV